MKLFKPPPNTYNMDAPKTRTEKKGRDKQKGTAPYSAKHVRLQEALANTKTKAKANAKAK
jgi:hypothetical protein